jgi:hypothetical protein
MQDMKPPHVAAALFVLALVATAIWWLQPGPPQPPNAVPVAAAPVAAPEIKGPAAESAPLPQFPSPTAAQLAADPSLRPMVAVGPPEAPTVGVAPGHAPEGTGVYARSVGDASKVLALAIEKAGGVRGLANWRHASYEILRTDGLGSRMLEVAVDAEGNVLQRDRQSGETEGLWRGTCWRRRADAVIPCTRRRAGLLEAMALAHPATTLLPLQGEAWQLRNAGVSTTDGRLTNTLTFASKTSSEAALGIDPETGRVRWLQVEEIRITFDDVQPRGDAQLPVQRSLRTRVARESEHNLNWTDRVQAIRPLVDARGLMPPPMTTETPLRVMARPTLAVVKTKLNGHAGLWDALTPMGDLFRLEEVPALDVYELEAAGELWVAVPPGVGGAKVKAKLEVVPQTPLVATRAVVCAFAEIPSALAKLRTDAEAAGHPVATAPAAARWLEAPDPAMAKVGVELQVPVTK